MSGVGEGFVSSLGVAEGRESDDVPAFGDSEYLLDFPVVEESYPACAESFVSGGEDEVRHADAHVHEEAVVLHVAAPVVVEDLPASHHDDGSLSQPLLVPASWNQLLLHGFVLDDDEPPRLTVAPTRRDADGFQYSVQHFIGNRFSLKRTHTATSPNDIKKLQ